MIVLCFVVLISEHQLVIVVCQRQRSDRQNIAWGGHFLEIINYIALLSRSITPV